MMGLFYVLLCFAAGWALTDRFLPDLRSPALNVHRILGTATFLGARRYPDAVRAGAALDVAVRPWLLVLVSSYLLGTLAVTWTVYEGATLFRHTEQPLWGGNLVAWGVWGAVVVLQGVSRRRTRFVPAGVGEWLRENRRELILLGVCALGSAALCSLTLFRRGDEIDLGLSVFSDFTTHIAQARSFSLGRNFPTEYVFFADGTVRYHFLFQFLNGNLEYLGMPLVWAYNLQSVLAFTAMFALLDQTAVALSGSPTAGILACLLAFFRSSFSSFVFLRQLPPGTKVLSAILGLDEFIGRTPHEDWGLWNQNVFVNQRHLPFGVAILLLVLLVLLPLFADLWDRLRREGREEPGDRLRGALGERVSWAPESLRRPLVLGIVLGASCFWNGAVYLGTLMVLFGLAWVSDHRLEYLILAVAALALGTLQKALFFGAEVQGIQPALHLGFLSPVPTVSGVAFYYAELLGLLPVMGLAAVLVLPLRGRFWLGLALILPFVAANLVRLTPDVNANHKYIQLSIWLGDLMVAALLAEMMRYKKTVLAALGLLAVLVSTGAVDLVSLWNRNAPNRAVVIREKDPLKLWIQDHLDPNGVILSKNYYMHPALAAGRKLYNGWQYYSWSAGYDTAARDRVVQEVLEGDDPTRRAALAREPRIRYILVDRETRKEFRVREDLLEREAADPRGRLRKLVSLGDTVIYEVVARD